MTAALGAGTAHVVVDMQRLFGHATAWQVPCLATVIEPIATIARRHPAQTIFTRFITPHSADDAAGSWRRYYQRWPMVLRGNIDAALLDLVEPLAAFVPPAEICDKTTFSAFHSAPFLAALDRRQVDTLVITGAETDVCVLATAFDAVDHGYRVIVVADAVTSLSESGHRATLDAIFARMDQQVEIVTVDAVLAAWPKG
jgi:nicotinamidase-related amidase